MATGGSLQDLLEEATCSICLDFFQDPVLIPECGHNFCRGCLTRSWGASESEASCPECRETYAPRSVLPIRQLGRVAEVVRGCSRHPEEEGGSFCPKHREPLKLFCKVHETPICLVCDRSKEHKGHSVIPAEEAFQEYQIKVEDCLKAQKDQKEKIATYKRGTDQTVQDMLGQIEKMTKNVVAEFRELQLWLEGQEKLLLTKLEEMEKDIMTRKEKGLAKHMEEVRSLDHLIQEIEEKHQLPASKLLQDVGSILKKFQAKETYENPVDLFLEPKWTIWYCSDTIPLLKNAIKKFRDTLESGLQLQEVNVTLNPDTADPNSLKISEDGKSIKGLKGYNHSVLGCQMFSSGRHLWDVIVDSSGRHLWDLIVNSSGRHFWDRIVRRWDVGVTSKPVNFENVHAQTRQWRISGRDGRCTAISPSEDSKRVLTERPTRIRISLNCEGGQVSFFDAKTAALLHTFSDASLVGETLLPYFYLGKGVCMTLP